MRKSITISLLISILLIITSCVSIPKETVQLSEVIGNDLVILHNSHRRSVQLYYRGIKENINSFIDEVYGPWIINNVVQKEMTKFKDGNKERLFGIIHNAANSTDPDAAKAAVDEIIEFNKDAFSKIEWKRRELLLPVEDQETKVLESIDVAYNNVIYGNTTLTAYLKSSRKVKESQQEVLKLAGLEGMDEMITDNLVSVSNNIAQLVNEGKQINAAASDAKEKIEGITERIKSTLK